MVCSQNSKQLFLFSKSKLQLLKAVPRLHFSNCKICQPLEVLSQDSERLHFRSFPIRWWAKRSEAITRAMHASNAMFGWSYVDVYPYGYTGTSTYIYTTYAPTMHGHGTVYVRGDLLHWPGGHTADVEQDLFVQTFWVPVHWPRGGTGRRPVRKKRPVKRVFFFWFPLRFSDASSRSGLTDFSPQSNIYLSIYLSISWDYKILDCR